MDEGRRAFLKAIAGRSVAVAGLAITAVALNERRSDLKRVWDRTQPLVKSFSPQATVYAQTTGAGTFTLKGTT